MLELYRKYRPKDFADVVGQPEAVRMLQKMLEANKVPHALLISGPSGTGKTTIARILKRKLGCGKHDFIEINAADSRGIDTVRDIKQQCQTAAISGSCKIFLLDECHKLTSDGMTALLKLLEDTPSHVYFFLATTDPGKLLKTIHTRCTEIKLVALPTKGIESVIQDVATKAKIQVSKEVKDRIAEVAEGSARKALVLLHQIADFATDKEQLECIQKADSKRQAIEICRLLLDSRTKWPEVAAVLKDLEEEPESIRHMILSYASAVVLGGSPKASRAYMLLTAFEGSFFESKKAGLVRACYEIFSQK